MSKKLQKITLGLMLFQLVFWTFIPLIAHHAPPLDATEMYGWSLTFQWGFYKHPPMPPWLLGVVQALVGRNLFSLFFTASLVISVTYYSVAWLANRFLPEKEAIVALFLYALTIYCNIWSTDFNHNQMQMPFWGLSLVCLVKTLDSGQLKWAFILGAVMGLNALSKYTAAMIVPCAIILLLFSPAWRTKMRWHHFMIASLAFLMVFGPHMFWLTQHDFMPFHYVNERFNELKETNRFFELADFIGNIGLAHIALLVAAFISLPTKVSATIQTKENRDFIWVLGAGPVVLTLVIGLFVPLYYRWVIPMLPMVTIIVAMVLKGRLVRFYSIQFFIVFAVLQMLLGLSYLYKDKINPEQSSRGNYPAPEIAQQINHIWQQSNPGKPLKIVSGGEWQAGFVSLFSPEKIYVFTQANTLFAPWISERDVFECGMVMMEPTSEELRRYPQAEIYPPLVLGPPHFKRVYEIHFALFAPQGICHLK
jgi:4-amino-4-deoxy-L-arabinose transferase-like glycosyltransferase